MQKKKVKTEIVEALYSTAIETQVSAIEQVRKDGFAEYLPILAEVYATSKNDEVKSNVAAVFQDLKDTKSATMIVSLLENTSSNELRTMLLTACWSSGIDYSKYLDTFVSLAIKHDYLMAFEALTVIENFETTPVKEPVLEAISRLKNTAIEDKTPKKDILVDMVNVLNHYVEQLEQ
ncbi:MAG: hypothetical protein PF489_03180 [Salinivirgaceae bacterium]|jgi:hypothetical protein|nr:hypothetical protein [Salinivirgaceae bacterium]